MKNATMEKILLCCLLCSVAVSPIAAQVHNHTQAQIIDGSKTPEQIPDEVARRLFFYNISTSSQPTDAEFAQQTGSLKAIGFTPAQIDNLRLELATFRRNFDAETTTYNGLVDASNGLAPYDIDTHLDNVVEQFRGRLPIAVLASLESKMQSEKSGMKMSASTSPANTSAASVSPLTGVVEMKSNYSSYGTAVTSANALGSLGGGLSVTLQGNATCTQANGQPAQCPISCTHTGTSSTIFDGGNVWSPDYPAPSDGSSISSVSSGTDGAVIGINDLGAPYVFSGNVWNPLSGAPGTVTNVSVYSATAAFAVVNNQAYEWNPTTNVWTLQTPPVSAGVKIVKVQGQGFFAALDSTNTLWIYYNNGTSTAWRAVPGTVYDIGASTNTGTAIGPANSNGNVYQVEYTTSATYTLVQGVPGPTLVSLSDGGAYGIDSSGQIWQNPNNRIAAWPKFTPATAPPITVKRMSGSGANLWFADGSGKLVRYFANVTTAPKQSVAPASYINLTGSNVAYNTLPGDLFDFTGSANLNCSCVGNLYAAGFSSSGVGIRLSAAVFSGLSSGRCTWTPTCSGTCSTPYTTNTNSSGGCYTTGPYRQCLDFVINNECVLYRVICFGQKTPGVCD